MRDLADTLLDMRRDAYLAARREHKASRAVAEQNKAATTAELLAWSRARKGLLGKLKALFA